MYSPEDIHGWVRYFLFQVEESQSKDVRQYKKKAGGNKKCTEI